MESKVLRKMALTTPEVRLRRIQRGCGIIEKILIVMIILIGIGILVIFDLAVSKEKLGFFYTFLFENPTAPSMPEGFGLVGLGRDTAVQAMQHFLLWMVFEMVMAMVFLILLCNIASATKKSGTPFLLKNARYLQAAGWILMVMGLLSPVMRNLTLGGAFESFSTFVLEPFSTLLTAGILLVLAKMFEYGCMLQQEYDETL